jgi:diguanylate cyclase (GGDEF)-like protein
MVPVHVERRTPTALLAAVYAVSGILCIVSALWPMHPATPVGVLWIVGLVGVVAGAALWAFRLRVRWWMLHAAVLLGGGLLGLILWHSATRVGIVGSGPALIALGLYAAHFFPLTAARLHALALIALATAGAVAAPPGGFAVPWIVLVVGVLGLTEAQARLAQSLRTAALTDPLTGVANRRAWESEAARHLARAGRTGEPVSFAILDLDDFKEVNDRQGHGAGDTLLRELTAGWTARLRRADLLGRYGGDEFVLCLPATDQRGAWEMLEQLASTHAFAWSAGVATVRAGDTLGTVLARADVDLYEQKRSRA